MSKQVPVKQVPVVPQAPVQTPVDPQLVKLTQKLSMKFQMKAMVDQEFVEILNEYMNTVSGLLKSKDDKIAALTPKPEEKKEDKKVS